MPPRVVIPPVIAPRTTALPRPVISPVSDSASDQPMLTPAPRATEKPTSSAVWELDAIAAVKIGASEETVPSIMPTSAGCTTRSTKSRSSLNPQRWIRRAIRESPEDGAVSTRVVIAPTAYARKRLRAGEIGLGHPDGGAGSASLRGGRTLPGRGRDRHVGEVQLGPAAHAHGVVDLGHAPAVRAGAAELVVLEAVSDSGEQAEDRDDARDQEPQHEGAALQLADDTAGEPEAHGDDDVGHPPVPTGALATPTPRPPRRGRARSCSAGTRRCG